MALPLQRYVTPTNRFNLLIQDREKRKKAKAKDREWDPKEKVEGWPENVIYEILTWLPVKQVFQYNSVCKGWYHNISSHAFKSKHLENYVRRKNHNGDEQDDCLIAQYYVSHAELKSFELVLDDSVLTHPKVVTSKVLSEMPSYGSYLCGPCDGIYYLYQYDFDKRTLWNPTINESKVLPNLITKPNLPCFTNIDEGYGFGCDHVNQNYKVIVIKRYEREIHQFEDDNNLLPYSLSILVYSSRNDSWKFVGNLAPNTKLYYNTCYTLVKQSYYWLGSNDACENNSNFFVVSFDIATDTFEELRAPEFEEPASKSLGVYDHSISIFAIHEESKRFDIWTLNDKARCWAKKFSADLSLWTVRTAMGHWKVNKIILEMDCSHSWKLVLYDPEADEQMKDFGYERSSWCQGVYAYMESLVSISDMGHQQQTHN